MAAVAQPRRHPAPWISALVGCIVAATIFAGFGPPGLLSPGRVCELGSRIGNYTIWTPEPIVNVPDGGGVGFATAVGFWNYTFHSGSLTVGAISTGTSQSSNGPGEGPPQAGIFAAYADYNWTFYRTQNVSKAGVASDPCTQPYVGEFPLPPSGCNSDWSTIPLPNNATDALEPHVWNATTGTNSTGNSRCPVRDPGTYVWFNSSFNSGGTGAASPRTWSLCGKTGYQWVNLTGVAQVPVVVTVPLNNASISVSGYLTWTAGHPGWPSVTYQVPAGWLWTLAPVGPTNGPIVPGPTVTDLLAFERSAC